MIFNLFILLSKFSTISILLFIENLVRIKHFMYVISVFPQTSFSHSSNKYLLSTYYTFNFKLFKMWAAPWGIQQRSSP